jgi:hypothetical protein
MATGRAQMPRIGLPRMAALPRPESSLEAQGTDSEEMEAEAEAAARTTPEGQREAEWQTGQTALRQRAPVEETVFVAPQR